MDDIRKEQQCDRGDRDSLEERVRRLEDLRAVEAVLVAYARCVDGRDAEGVGALFTEEGTLRVPEASPLVGRDRIANVYRRLLGALKASTHVVSNQEARLVGPDRAEVRCVLWAWEGFEGSLVFEGAQNRFSFGRYEAVMVRGEDGRWLMESLTISFAGQTASK